MRAQLADKDLALLTAEKALNEKVLREKDTVGRQNEMLKLTNTRLEARLVQLDEQLNVKDQVRLLDVCLSVGTEPCFLSCLGCRSI